MKKKIGIIAGIMVGLALIAYGIGVFYYSTHFMMNTYADQKDISNYTLQDAIALYQNEKDEMQYTVRGRNQAEFAWKGSEIALTSNAAELLNQELEKENELLWFVSLWKKTEVQIQENYVFDETLLEDKFKSSSFFDPELRSMPTNAEFGGFDPNKQEYILIPENNGAYIIEETAMLQMKQAILEKNQMMEMPDECYLAPGITLEDPDLNELVSSANKYVSSNILYDWHGIELEIGSETIKDFISITDSGKAIVSKDHITEYLTTISEELDTYKKEREYTTTSGEIVQITKGDYGWLVDVETESEYLYQSILVGKKEEREPEYLYTAFVKGEDDIGDTFIEIDLGNQHMYAYENGELSFESDLVSGNVSAGNSTPKGIYKVDGKAKNKTLKGPTWESFVNFWIPFNGAIGMHDASWRKKFGGEIYLTGGSHGCVNLPYKTAEKVYNLVSKGFPVIVY